MKRANRTPLRLDYRDALKRMFRGSKLIQTNNKRVEFSVTPGGNVSDVTAQMLIEHSLCEPADTGLLDGAIQSWKFNLRVVSDT